MKRRMREQAVRGFQGLDGQLLTFRINHLRTYLAAAQDKQGTVHFSLHGYEVGRLVQSARMLGGEDKG